MSSLAYLQGKVTDSLRQEDESPRLTADAARRIQTAAERTVAGFPVYDGAAEEEQRKQEQATRRARLKSFRDAEQTLREKLTQLGITPLAIVPKVAWDRLCQQAGLYRLTPDSSGAVGVNTDVLNTFKERATDTVIFVVLGLALLSAVVTCPLLIVSGGVHWSFALVTALVAAVCTGIFFTWVTHHRNWKRDLQLRVFIERGLIKWQIHRFCRQSWQKTLETLMPEGEASYQWGSASTKIVLPPAPDAVKSVLVNAQSLPLKVAVVPEAFAFETPVSEILGREYQISEEKRRRELDLLADPIIYTEMGPAVAVLAQFGDFPMEEKVIDEITGSVHLI